MKIGHSKHLVHLFCECTIAPTHPFQTTFVLGFVSTPSLVLTELLSGTIIRGTPNTLNSAGNHHQHKLQSLMGAIQVKAPSTQGT
jgi:hypothetical protein